MQVNRLSIPSCVDQVRRISDNQSLPAAQGSQQYKCADFQGCSPSRRQTGASLRLVMVAALRLMQRNLCLRDSTHQVKKASFEGQYNIGVCLPCHYGPLLKDSISEGEKTRIKTSCACG
ncbi:unnamed protein product [Fusarium graminearum]|uniref:Chromosome 1, complete genome n=1 Tax=Gibberella zeae (strain ATCC MYA-4620 / CBS 123657 / FGSC 9075 / NRRL 31084 / PH-1) TaxID=229533 RepID=I1SA68_GIBZE|nr:hypothetical protein FGSG_13749 [Fusarium graminearum PH-1]ESU17091.1 hypothetical protein FGSG_13749 [Fusarium graminearum PH-1]CEF75788.1 unnamed protein product [Fusarium graminearum]CZS79069.1 unnamed protein product [Fusarium graminearum]|eukprot:XP_011319353.1 hypothetical protein FGSG_13749 [Fusarium graminearum PH-1]